MSSEQRTVFATDAPSNTNGKKGQAVTKPIFLDASTGEVLVSKSTGKAKVRKGQTEEEYVNQLHHYFNVENGPTVTGEKWMDGNDPWDFIKQNDENDITLKQTRMKLICFCERYYYQRKYKECLELSTKLKEMFQDINKKNKMQREIDELIYLVERSQLRLNMETVSRFDVKLQ